MFRETLKELDIGAIHLISKDGLIKCFSAEGSNWCALSSLRLSAMPQVDDDVLVTINRNIPRLKDFHFDECASATDNAIPALSSTELQALSLGKYKHLQLSLSLSLSHTHTNTQPSHTPLLALK